ncbi:MAG: TolC family protein [bacterium]|nr:TolC family protein [bacterium]
MDEIFNLAIENRPDAKKFEIRLKLVQIELAKSRIKNKPIFTLSANYNFNSKGIRLKDLGSDFHEKNWGISGSISFPVQDGGISDAEIKRASLELKKMEFDYEEMKRKIKEEIEQLMENLESDKRKLDILNLSLDTAKENLEISQLKYTEGMIDSEDVLRSQLSLFQVENSLNEVRIAQVIDRVKLLKTIGILVDPHAKGK